MTQAGRILTKVLGGVAPAFAPFVGVSLWTMLERLVAIANVIEKVDLLFSSE
jgi:hypothetical protein